MAAAVSIVVVPRERFSCAQASLASLYQTTATPFELIYVEAGAPTYLRRHLDQQAAARGFTLLRHDELLGSNRARNLGLARAGGRYVVFIDNDVVFRPGWLEQLLRCAEETGADVVNPLHFIGELEQQIIHFAGSAFELEARGPLQAMREQHRHVNTHYPAVREQLQRTRSDIAEFHCILIRRELLERMGGFDDGMLNLAEHLDFSLAVRALGGSIWLEPAAQVSYLATRESVLSDVSGFIQRWNEDWTQRTLQHFVRKWRLDPDCETVREQSGFAANHRTTVGIPFLGPGAPAATAQRPAQTHLQLYRQCQALGYRDEELQVLRRSYEQAVLWFGHHFRASGRPFLCHLVGTASVLAAHGAPRMLVVAGLLHPVYQHVAPDPATGRVPAAQRQALQPLLGYELERLLHAFATFDWKADPQAVQARLPLLPLTAAQVILLRLAGDLEEALEQCPQYSRKNDPQPRRWLELSTAVAEALGFGAMAAEFGRALGHNAAVAVPDVLRSTHARSYVIQRPPQAPSPEKSS
jgi:GT2 family glycosyltransferase